MIKNPICDVIIKLICSHSIINYKRQNFNNQKNTVDISLRNQVWSYTGRKLADKMQGCSGYRVKLKIFASDLNSYMIFHRIYLS